MPSIYKNGQSPFVVVKLPDMADRIAFYDPAASPLATLMRSIENRDYEDAKEFIREVVEAYQ